jgi:hypothetical protein
MSDKVFSVSTNGKPLGTELTISLHMNVLLWVVLLVLVLLMLHHHYGLYIGVAGSEKFSGDMTASNLALRGQLLDHTGSNQKQGFLNKRSGPEFTSTPQSLIDARAEVGPGSDGGGTEGFSGKMSEGQLVASLQGH